MIYFGVASDAAIIPNSIVLPIAVFFQWLIVGFVLLHRRREEISIVHNDRVSVEQSAGTKPFKRAKVSQVIVPKKESYYRRLMGPFRFIDDQCRQCE